MSRLLMAFVSTGLVFMLFPGTLLGVWNLLQISGRERGGDISAAWLQAHGHAQVFGRIVSFRQECVSKILATHSGSRSGISRFRRASA
jgi:hypothetical protein